ncbi:MAG TPA: helix-turn-helix transcriptional regulator [Candidatus Limnocylindrales bacterium]|nr:helix-turn-helix transcriptional regulator [Candidatus Limnocylindrales bacterium]
MTDRQLLLRVGAIVKDLRLAIRWSQRELAARSGVSQSLISAIENGRVRAMTFVTIQTLVETMGGRLIVDVARPFLGDRPLQGDAAHARCVSFVAGRLRRAGWQVATEIEIGGDRSRGWIDVLAFDPRTGVVLVIEVKTEIHDVGGIERALGWYEREAWTAARRRGWQPRSTVGFLVLLATAANDERLQENRSAFAAGFPTRARSLMELVERAPQSGRVGRGLAMVDPLSRRRAWLRPTVTDGRRSPAPHADYVSFLAKIQRRPRGRAVG